MKGTVTCGKEVTFVAQLKQTIWRNLDKKGAL